MEISPRKREEFPPFRDNGVRIHCRLATVQSGFEEGEISVEKSGFIPLTFRLAKAAAEKVGDIFHSAPAADILKIQTSDGISLFGEAKVGELGVTVDKGLELGIT